MAARAPHLHVVSPESSQSNAHEQILEHPFALYLGDISVRSGGYIDASVPHDLIEYADVPVDNAHVESLMRKISEEAEHNPGSTGQLSPVLAAVMPSQPEVLPLFDGFHRAEALKRLGRDNIYATLRWVINWSEVLDLRIDAAVSHEKIKFARLVEWVTGSWGLTEWANDYEVTQAFSMVVRTSKDKANKAPQDEEEAIKEWVTAKCMQWRLAPSSVYKHLSVASIADPSLVKEARERSSGRSLEALTPQHVSVIARTLPGRDQFDLQRLIASIAKTNNLTVPQTRAAAERVMRLDIEGAREFFETPGWDKAKRTYSPSRAREIRAAARIEMQPLDRVDYAIDELTAANRELRAALGSLTAINQNQRHEYAERILAIARGCANAARVLDPSVFPQQPSSGQDSRGSNIIQGSSLNVQGSGVGRTDNPRVAVARYDNSDHHGLPIKSQEQPQDVQAKLQTFISHAQLFLTTGEGLDDVTAIHPADMMRELSKLHGILSVGSQLPLRRRFVSLQQHLGLLAKD